MAKEKAEVKEKTTGLQFAKYDEIMTVNDLMECLKIGENTAYDLVKSGEIDSFMIGTRNKRVLKQSVIKYIERSINQGTGAK